MNVKTTIIAALIVIIGVPFAHPAHALTPIPTTTERSEYAGIWNTEIRGSSATATLAFTGWAVNRSNPSEVVSVVIARGKTGNNVVATIRAERGPDLATSTGVAGKHRFNWTVPLAYYGTTDTWHISLIQADGTKKKLVNSPRQFTFGPAPKQPAKGKFKIFWGINTRIEPLADLVPGGQNASDLERVKSIVQGYMVTVLNGGRLSYWPNRPRRCAINDKEDRGPQELTIADTVNGVRTTATYQLDTLRSECDALLASSTASIAQTKAPWRNLPLRSAQGRIHEDAMSRALDNLGIRSEVARGKRLEAELLMSDPNVDYDPTTDSLSMKTSSSSGEYLYPKSFRFLKEYGVVPASGLAYQEPSKQEGSELIRIPLSVKSSRVGVMPQNGRILDMYGDAFVKTGVQSPKLRTNVRVWVRGVETGVQKMLVSEHFGGINIEGGTSNVDDATGGGENKVANYAKAIAWLFRNAPETTEASILMPSFIDEDEMVNQATYDINAINRVTRYMRTLDRELKANGVHYGVCTDRLVIITGGYGRWLHPEMFPISRGGRTAGTTSGLVVALDKVRTDLCGEGEVRGAMDQTITEVGVADRLDTILSAMEREFDALRSRLGL